MPPIDPMPLMQPIAVPAPRLVPKSIAAVAEIIESGPNKKTPTVKNSPAISQIFLIGVKPTINTLAANKSDITITGARRAWNQVSLMKPEVITPTRPPIGNAAAMIELSVASFPKHSATYFWPQNMKAYRTNLMEKYAVASIQIVGDVSTSPTNFHDPSGAMCFRSSSSSNDSGSP